MFSPYIINSNIITNTNDITNYSTMLNSVGTNLGNSYSDIGRYISAIDCFSNALLINDNFAMASLNLSRLLFLRNLLRMVLVP